MFIITILISGAVKNGFFRENGLHENLEKNDFFNNLLSTGLHYKTL